MTRATRIVALVTVAAALVWGYRILFPSDEQRIRRELADLTDAANHLSGEDDLGRLAAAARVGRHFTDDVAIDYGREHAVLRGREQVVALAARRRGTGWRAAIEDVHVSLDGLDSARARVTATITDVGSDGHPSVDRRELTLGVRRVDDRWLIASVRVLDAAESLGTREENLRPAARPSIGA